MAEIERRSDGTYVRTTEPSKGSGERDWGTAEDPTQPLVTLVRSLRTKQNWRQTSDDLALQLYSDMRYVGYRGGNATYDISDVIDSRVGTNVIRAIVRTLNSKIARRRSRPYVVTNGASFQQRMTAENLEKWLLGKLRTLRADEEAFPLWRLHALVTGTGCLRVMGSKEKGVWIEVVPSTEIFVDDSEARYGTPRNIYFVRTASRRQLKHDYPERAEVIDKLATERHDNWNVSTGSWDTAEMSDVCTVIEAIRLPSGPEADDGRHSIVTAAGWLYDGPWEKNHFYCAWMRGELRPMGFWGIGVPEDLAATQIELSKTALARQEIIELLSNPYWLIERGMKVAKSAISNLVGRVMEWTSTGSGHKPELVAPNAVPNELWQHEDTLKRTAFETKGVSQLSAQMLKPQGLNSGKALRAYTELESELLSDLMNDYEGGLLRICELMVEKQIDLAHEFPDSDHSVTHLADGALEEIHWKDVGLEKDLRGYVIEILPASALASTLSARIEDVYDMKDLGLLTDAEETWDYLDMPDRRRLKRKRMAPRRLLERTIEVRIIKNGEDVQPEPTWDLDLAVQLSLTALAELELYDDAPQDRMELLRVFLERCRQILNPPQPPAPMPGMEMTPDGTDLGTGLDPTLGGINPADAAAAAAGGPGTFDAGSGLGAAEGAAAGTAGIPIV